MFALRAWTGCVLREDAMAGSDSFDRTSRLTTIGVFVAMVVDGMDLQMLAVALPSISKDLGLSSVTAGALSTYTLLGMGLGGILAGWLSDRFGRIRVVWWSIFIFTACTAVIAMTSGYWQIAVMRFVSGFGISGLYSVGTLLGTECAPTRIRTTVLGVLQAGWSVGYVIAALCASYLLPHYGWRPLFLCSVIPGAIALMMLWGLPDPASFSVAKARGGSSGRNDSFRLISSNPAQMRMLMLWTITTVALQFGYYGANTWLPSYLVTDLGVNLQSMGWYVAATYAMMVVGKIITGYLADIYGRRAMWIGSCLLTAIYLPIAIYVASPANVAYILLIFGFLYGAPYAVSATYMSESFPAGIRGTAVGTAYNIGRAGAMLSPLLIGMAASRYSIGLGIGMLGLAYAVCGLVPAFFIKEKQFDPKAVDASASAAEPTAELAS
jgi:AAHS family cis,cis-muconate transporter-like MFS transporter